MTTSRVHDERGTYAVLFAVIMMIFFAFAAIVVDLGAVRSDIRANQITSDVAATAGAAELDPASPGTVYTACVAAWDYFLANTPGAGNAPHPCATFASMPQCVPWAASTRRAITTAGPYKVTIVYPVRSTDPLMLARENGDHDGNPCERIGVEVVSERSHLFGGLLGSSKGNGPASAVARNGGSGSNGKGVAMLILDPTGCNALLAKGQAKVTVNASGGWPGIIAVDSSATETNPAPGESDRNCSNSNSYAIDAVGTQNSRIVTNAGFDPMGNPIEGQIYSFALMPGQNNAQSYEPADVSAGRLAPQPEPQPRITRQPIDWRYNCKLANACPDAGTTVAHIDALRATVGSSGKPAGFREYPAEVPQGKCSLPPSNPPILLVGNWWINCPTLDVSTAFVMTGGNAVFQGTVNVGSQGSFAFNAGSMTDRWIYVRSGNFEKDAQASVLMDNTFVYLNNGTIQFGAGSGLLRWIAPHAGPFEDLALWSESKSAHNLGGQATLDIEGVFFTPNAYPMRFTGQGSQQQAKAQFITYRLEITGQGDLMLAVDPERSVKVPLTGVKLIR